MGLKEVKAVREFLTFTPEGMIQKIYRISFTTEKTPGEFTVEMPIEEFTPEKARKLAEERAAEIDRVVG